MPKSMTAMEAADEFGIVRRTFTRLVSAGLVTAVGKRASTGGRPVELYDRDQIEKALRSSTKRLHTNAGKTGRKTPATIAPSNLPATEPITPPTPEKPASSDLEQLEPDELADMLRRLRQAERVSGSMWAAAVKGKAHTVAEQAILQRSWKDASDQVLRFEKMLPEILYKKSRYVDVEKVAKILNEAASGMASELDMVGASVAPLCVDKPVLAIRTIVDDAVRNARRNMVAALNKITGV